MDIEIRELGRYEFVRLAPIFVDLYIEAMGYQTAIRDARIAAWRQHTQLPGFSAVMACAGQDVVGIAYGHSGGPMNWWHLQIQRGLHDRGLYGPEERRALANYFELSEIHVRPQQQGQGIGKELLFALVSGTRHPVVLLSTPEIAGEANGAFGLYRKLGFVDFLRHHSFAGDDRPFAILQANLPLGTSDMAAIHQPRH